MKKYIPTLMEVYQEMIKANSVTNNKREDWLINNPTKKSWDYYGENNKYSDTMLHNLISIINKLNNL